MARFFKAFFATLLILIIIFVCMGAALRQKLGWNIELFQDHLHHIFDFLKRIEYIYIHRVVCLLIVRAALLELLSHEAVGLFRRQALKEGTRTFAHPQMREDSLWLGFEIDGFRHFVHEIHVVEARGCPSSAG